MNNEEAVITWLRQNAMPIQHIEARHGFDDLQPLKALLKEAKVVGLGETTHGTREFFQFKHRLLEFLVTEMGFTALVIEGSYTGFQPINDYILHGVGDPASVLTGQGYVVWDTEELAAMVAWMRAYNQQVSDDKKVRFHGVDIAVNALARPAIMDYLKKVGSERVAATEAVFATLAREEAKWPASFDEDTPAILAGLLPQFDELIACLTANQAAFVERSSPEDFESALQHTRVIWQWLIGNTPESLRPAHPGDLGRGTFMPENMLALIDRGQRDTKYIVWAHNGHISNGYPQSGKPNWGSQLRARYGDKYYAFAFDFNQGSFHTRKAMPDKGLGDLVAVTVPLAPEGS